MEVKKRIFNTGLISDIKTLMNFVPKRERDVIARRFGLFNKDKETLESIGRFYGITRERVRQIQDHGIHSLKTKALVSNIKLNKIFNIIEQKIEESGGMANEENLLKQLQQNDKEKNYLRLLFVLNKNLCFLKKNNEFYPRWIVSDKTEAAPKIEAGLISLARSIPGDEVLSFEEIVQRFQGALKIAFGNENDNPKTFLSSWLNTSKSISQNKFGEWGLVSSCYIAPKGVKDYAYLSMRRHGSPMHFREVSEAIHSHFTKPVHIQTVHNELIKDERFVLVGRGLYALKEWGYIPGTVKDVISHILRTHPRTSKEDLIKRILKERHVKEATIAINLQNKKFFKKFPDGAYGLV